MTRCAVAAVLMVVLLIVCLLTGAAMTRVSEEMCRELELAREAALEENWAQALVCEAAALARWGRAWHPVAAVADHGPMEEIDSLFAQLEVYRRTRATESYAAICTDLARRTEALSGTHTLNWWSLL